MRVGWRVGQSVGRRDLTAMVAFALLLGGCSTSSSSGPKSCPPCGAGLVCDSASGRCVSQNAGNCGANASASTGVCQCNSGFSDCNNDREVAGGDGCECSGVCQGTSCSTCNDVTNRCPGTGSYCNSGKCEVCPSGSYNCDGLGSCEETTPCAGSCSATSANACGGASSFCDQGSCRPCAVNTYNCDGISVCESSTPCTPCDPTCHDEADWLCVRDNNNFCRDCTADEHCTGNPRSNGPRCDTAQMFCTCSTDADCEGHSIGIRCKTLGTTKLCGCDTNADCTVQPYVQCNVRKCEKPCTSNTDCKGGDVCDIPSGQCVSSGP